MALPKFLLQTREGQKGTVYRWTEALAKRLDMRPITGKEAKKIIDAEELEKTERMKKHEEDPFDDSDSFEENDITANVEKDLKDEEKKPAEHPSFKTQETIKADEIEKIESFRKSTTLESYLLEKYRLDMLPGDLESMKSQAISFINELERKGKLYHKLNE